MNYRAGLDHAAHIDAMVGSFRRWLKLPAHVAMAIIAAPRLHVPLDLFGARLPFRLNIGCGPPGRRIEFLAGLRLFAPL
jgi:hypothetical protein